MAAQIMESGAAVIAILSSAANIFDVDCMALKRASLAEIAITLEDHLDR